MLTEADFNALEAERIYLTDELAEASTDMTMTLTEWDEYKRRTVKRIRELTRMMIED